MAEVFANSVYPDQMPRSAVSDLGLHCLPITLLQVSRLQWVKNCWIECNMANRVDPDQTLHSVASALGLHCLIRPVCPNTRIITLPYRYPFILSMLDKIFSRQHFEIFF